MEGNGASRETPFIPSACAAVPTACDEMLRCTRQHARIRRSIQHLSHARNYATPLHAPRGHGYGAQWWIASHCRKGYNATKTSWRRSRTTTSTISTWGPRQAPLRAPSHLRPVRTKAPSHLRTYSAAYARWRPRLLSVGALRPSGSAVRVEGVPEHIWCVCLGLSRPRVAP